MEVIRMFDDAEGMVFRPPSEANSFILRITIGCSYNRCTFCGMYKNVKFRVRPLPEVEALINEVARHYPSLRRVFLADGNALALPLEHLLTVMDKLKRSFPKLTRITSYGGPRDLLSKTPAELAALKKAGLQIIYLGIESGDDEVLQAVNKGVSAQEMIVAGRRVMDAGIKLSAMVILGLGGQERTLQHAVNTGKVISAISPTMLSTLTLMLHEGSEIRAAADAGKFTPLSPYGYMSELKMLLQHTAVTSPCIFRSSHVSNLLPLAGNLPADKDLLIADTNEVLEHLANKKKPMYNDIGNF